MLPIQCRMARTALAWGVRDLAQAADVSHDTVVRFERGEELKDRTVAAMHDALKRGGVEFITENGSGPGVRLARPLKRKRAK
jgi:ribosome-binding protein aMBF1 (putative translation factor)